MSEKFRKVGPDKIFTKDNEATIHAYVSNSIFKDAEKPAEPEERIKTPEEEQLIKIISNSLSLLLKDHGIKPRLILYERIRLYNPDSAPPSGTEDTSVAGTTEESLHEIKVYADQNDLSTLAHVLIHELLHLHSFTSFELDIDDTTEDFTVAHYSPRRSGLIMRSNRSQSDAFRYLNEAVIEEMTIMFAEEIFRLNNLVFEFDKETAYINERSSFNKLVQALSDSNGGGLIRSLFMEAVLTGNVLEIARRIEKTFGKGSFRELGERFSVKNPQIDDILARAHETKE